MAGIDVILLYNSEFGTRGSGDDQFEYPTGVCIVGDNMYVVDKQNHRIKKHELGGTFVSSFGAIGAGNDNFFFPENIVSDGTYLYITDSANHRVKTHDLDGVYVSQFGSAGSGDDNFSYPIGITVLNGYLWIADKQNNRVKQHTTAGIYTSQITGFSFPEGIATINGEIVIADSANKHIDFYTTAGSFLRRSVADLEYPTQIQETNGILTVLDKQASRLVFLTAEGVFVEYFGSVGGGQNRFLFPTDVVYNEGILYVVDSGNHHVQNYDITIEENIPIYTDLFVRLTKRLYPTGRAWWLKRNSIFERVHAGLAYSESRMRSIFEELLNSILPDNDYFTAEDATNWERALGLYNQSALDLDTRKIAITRKMRYPGEAVTRQHYTFLQAELHKAGFTNVIVTENRFGDPLAPVAFIGAIYNDISYGGAAYGQQEVDSGDAEKLANYIDPVKDAGFDFGSTTNLRATWFISGDPFPTIVAVDEKRKNEFRELMLRLKPAQTAGYLFVKFRNLSGNSADSTVLTADSTVWTADQI